MVPNLQLNLPAPCNLMSAPTCRVQKLLFFFIFNRLSRFLVTLHTAVLFVFSSKLSRHGDFLQFLKTLARESKLNHSENRMF